MTKQSTRPDAVTDEVNPEHFLAAKTEAKERYGRFNLAVIGNTGVGKSSLVNAVFGRDLAKVGKGLPVTRGAHYYHDDALGVWDLEGFEIGTSTSPAEQLRANLKAISERPKLEQISVVWYCVLSTADRLSDADIGMIRELYRAGLPVVVVLTKVDWVRNQLAGSYRMPQDVLEFANWLREPTGQDGRALDLPISMVIPTSTRDRNGKGSGHGLGDLVAATLALSPIDGKDAFRVAQQLNLPWKRELARPVVASAAGAAAAAVAIPTPVTDAVVLAPIQLAMMGRISAIYDLELKSMLSASAIAQLSVQITGQALARSFIKLIPGAGSILGASVAFALTAAMGEAWIRLCEQIHTGKVDIEKISDHWRDYLPGVVDVLRKMVSQRSAGS